LWYITFRVLRFLGFAHCFIFKKEQNISVTNLSQFSGERV